MKREMRAPAKINLALLVGPRLPSGYHELFTVFLPISLYDELDFWLTATPAVGSHGSVRVSCPGLEVDSNLVTRALAGLEAATGWAFEGTVDVAKHIPVAAGLGGGSSDAAAALVAGAAALAEAGAQVDMSLLHRVAAGVGADVPFFLGSGPAIATGIGDRLEPIQLPALSVVLALPSTPLSTADAYHTLDEARAPESTESFARRVAERRRAWRDLTACVQPGSMATSDAGPDAAPDSIVRMLENDLERASFVLRPELLQVKEAVLRAGALGSLMSGSGPTVFGLCRSPEHAAVVCANLRSRGHDCTAVASHVNPAQAARADPLVRPG